MLGLLKDEKVHLWAPYPILKHNLLYSSNFDNLDSFDFFDFRNVPASSIRLYHTGTRAVGAWPLCRFSKNISLKICYHIIQRVVHYYYFKFICESFPVAIRWCQTPIESFRCFLALHWPRKGNGDKRGWAENDLHVSKWFWWIFLFFSLKFALSSTIIVVIIALPDHWTASLPSKPWPIWGTIVLYPSEDYRNHFRPQPGSSTEPSLKLPRFGSSNHGHPILATLGTSHSIPQQHPFEGEGPLQNAGRGKGPLIKVLTSCGRSLLGQWLFGQLLYY